MLEATCAVCGPLGPLDDAKRHLESPGHLRSVEADLERRARTYVANDAVYVDPIPMPEHGGHRPPGAARVIEDMDERVKIVFLGDSSVWVIPRSLIHPERRRNG